MKEKVIIPDLKYKDGAFKIEGVFEIDKEEYDYVQSIDHFIYWCRHNDINIMSYDLDSRKLAHEVYRKMKDEI